MKRFLVILFVVILCISIIGIDFLLNVGIYKMVCEGLGYTFDWTNALKAWVTLIFIKG